MLISAGLCSAEHSQGMNLHLTFTASVADRKHSQWKNSSGTPQMNNVSARAGPDNKANGKMKVMMMVVE